MAVSSKSQRLYQVGCPWAAGQDLQPGGKTVISTIWLSNPFSQPHELGTAKITFTDTQNEMLKDEVVSLRAISKPTLSHKNRHPKMVVVAAVIDTDVIGIDNVVSFMMIRNSVLAIWAPLPPPLFSPHLNLFHPSPTHIWRS